MTYQPKHLKDPGLGQTQDPSLFAKWWGLRVSLSSLMWQYRTDAELMEAINALMVYMDEITDLLNLQP
jgi:hypothetical protein